MIRLVDALSRYPTLVGIKTIANHLHLVGPDRFLWNDSGLIGAVKIAGDRIAAAAQGGIDLWIAAQPRMPRSQADHLYGRDYSSRSNIAGSTDSARWAGTEAASNPTNDIARTTPTSTIGSRGVA